MQAQLCIAQLFLKTLINASAYCTKIEKMESAKRKLNNIFNKKLQKFTV